MLPVLRSAYSVWFYTHTPADPQLGGLPDDTLRLEGRVRRGHATRRFR